MRAQAEFGAFRSWQTVSPFVRVEKNEILELLFLGAVLTRVTSACGDTLSRLSGTLLVRSW